MTNEQLEKAVRLADALPRLMELSNGRYGDKVFSKNFILKNIFGFTDDELAENEKGIIEEKAELEFRKKQIEAKVRAKEVNSDFLPIPDEEKIPYSMEIAKSNGRW